MRNVLAFAGHAFSSRPVTKQFVNRIQNRCRRTERNIQMNLVKIRRLCGKIFSHFVKTARIRTLKTVNRLFPIADGKYRPHCLTRAFAGKKICSQRFDNRPLIRRSVLRLVNQYMVNAPVQLKQNPVRHRTVFQKGTGQHNQILIVHFRMDFLKTVITADQVFRQKQNRPRRSQQAHRLQFVFQSQYPFGRRRRALGKRRIMFKRFPVAGFGIRLALLRQKCRFIIFIHFCGKSGFRNRRQLLGLCLVLYAAVLPGLNQPQRFRPVNLRHKRFRQTFGRVFLSDIQPPAQLVNYRAGIAVSRKQTDDFVPSRRNRVHNVRKLKLAYVPGQISQCLPGTAFRRRFDFLQQRPFNIVHRLSRRPVVHNLKIR